MDTFSLEQYLHLGMLVGFLLVIAKAGISWRLTSLFSARAHLWFWSILAAGLAADLVTKHLAFSYLEPGNPVTIIPQMLDLRPFLNPGTSGGTDIDVLEWTRTATLGCLAVVGLFIVSRRDLRWLHIALALFLAGAAGNILDRTCFMRAETVRYMDGDDPKVIAVDAHQYIYDGLIIRQWGSTQPKLIRWSSRPEVLGERAVVRDFIGVWRQPVGKYAELHIMNVADIMLMVGPLIVIVLALNVLLTSYWNLFRRLLTPRPPPPTML